MSYSKPYGDSHRLFFQTFNLNNNTTVYNDINSAINLGDIYVDDVRKTNLPQTLPLSLSHHSIESPNLVSEWKFYKWQSELDPALNDSRIKKDNFIANTNKSISSKFERTKPLTIRNYFEGGDGQTILFGEKDYDVSNRNSPHVENAFIYNPPSIQSIYQATSSSQYSNHLGTKWYFQNWENGSTSLTREEQITQSSASEWWVNYKGIQRSDQANAYSNNSQRKFVRGFSQLGGGFFNTYSSMNKVWLEFNDNSCTDNAWHIMNNGKPLSDNESKNPSVDYWEKDALETFAFVAYQEKNSGAGYSIKVKVFNQNTTAIIYSGNVINESTESYLTDASPVIAVGKGFDNIYANTIIVCWYKKDNGDNRSAGFYIKYGYFNFDYGTNEYKLNWLSPTPIKITGTNTNSLNASLSAPKQISGNYDFVPFHITYEESSQINYQKIKLRGNGSYAQLEQPINISAGSGYSSNYKPSIVAFADTSSRICWIGERIEEPGIIEKTVVFTASDYLGYYWTFGSSVNSVSINRNNSCYTIAWASSNNDQIKYTDCSTLGSLIHLLHIKGKDVQLANGTTPATMYALAFNTTQQPHYMQTGRLYSPEEQPPIEPEEQREGIAGEEDAQVYFNIGDVMVDDEQISFVDIPGTVVINSLQTANEYLVSKPFMLTENSNFFYSVKYGITDSMLASNMFQGSKALTFKVELLDVQTNEVLGVFDEVTYNQANIEPYEKIDYQVLTNGIGERLVKMRLVIGSSFNPNYSVAEKYAEPTGLAKKNCKQISYQGSLAVDKYDLSQNYPNPFNPSTTINYQLKEEGLVILKIYDILGSEIKTLVKEEKTKGRYVHNFNGSDLASGVYIYQLRVNDFVSSKKLILLK